METVYSDTDYIIHGDVNSCSLKYEWRGCCKYVTPSGQLTLLDCTKTTDTLTQCVYFQ
jgi:hypothetical protein